MVVPRRTCLPGAGDCSQTPMRRGTSESRKPPPRSALELEVALLGRPLGVVERQAGEVGHGDPLLARDAEGGQRGGAAARGGGDVDHVRAGASATSRAEAAAADLRAPALDPDPRAARADACR